MSRDASEDDEYFRLLGQVVDIAGAVEQQMAAQLALIVSRGDARVGLLVVGGESAEWMAAKLGRIGGRFPAQFPDLEDWADRCHKILERRNRIIHDWHALAEDGTRTSIRFTRRDSAASLKGLAYRPNVISEIRQLNGDLEQLQGDFVSLVVGLGSRLATLDPDGK